jgi:sugar lactone lactonase YvrE
MSCLPSVSRPYRSSCVQNHSLHTLPRHAHGGHSLCVLKAFLAIAALALPALAASAQARFGSQPIGTSATQTVSVAVSGGATVSAIQVLTMGKPGQDFQPGGTFNCGAQSCSQPVTFAPLYPGLRQGAVVALDASNNVLGTTYISGTGAGGLGVLVPGTARTIAGDGDWKGEGDDEAATSTELFLPTAVALDGAGNLYIADSAHNRIRIVCAAAGAAFPGITCTRPGYIYTVAGTQGTAGYSGDGQVSTASGVELNMPSGLAIDGAGNLYIADTSNNVVREISSSTGIITTIAGTGARGFSGDGAAAVSAQFHSPTGLAVDPNGNVYIADEQNNRIRVVCAGSTPVLGVACAEGNIVTVAGSGGTTLGDGAAATAAMLSAPYTVALDPAGNLYIADSGNNRVRMVSASASGSVMGISCKAPGVIATVAGNGSQGFNGDGGPATGAELFAPSGVAVDPAGNLYIADTQNFRIRKVSAAGVITSVAGTATGGFGGDGGPATSAGIYGPYGLALDGSGNLFVAEYLDNRVREIQANLSIASFRNSVRQGSTSSTMNITVENDGAGPLDLTGMDAGTNTATDQATTTCSTSTPLTVDAQCVVGAIFSPAAKPALTSNQAETGDISLSDETVAGTPGSNSPLVIQVSGVATPVNSTTVTLTSNLNPSSFGQSVTFSAAVTTGEGTGALTGTVNFYNGTTKLQSGVALNSSKVATFTIPSLPVGANSITATYNEDGKDLLHFGSTSDPLAQVVQEKTAILLASSANPSALNAAVTFTATVSTPGGGGVPPDGTVSFLDGGNTIGAGTLSGGVAALTISTLSDGPHAITAVYGGDANLYIEGSTSGVLKQDVLAASTVSLSSSPASNSVYGTPVTFTAAVTGSTNVTPSGTVNFLDGATKLGSGKLSAGGVATFTTASLGARAHSITAAYLGDSNSGPGTSTPLTFTVAQTPTTTSISATPMPAIAGKAVTLIATVKMNSGSAMTTGTITFMDGSATLGSAKVGSNGTASITPTLSPGAHAVVATYSGDENDAASTSSALALPVNLATTTVTVRSSASPATVLQSITFTAAVTGNGGMPTGSVVFSVDGASSSTATLDASGKASFSDAALAVGSHIVTVTYAGDTNDSASTSSQLTQVIEAIPTSTSLGTASTAGPNPQTILVASVSGSGGPTPTGTVVFMNGNTAVGTATLDVNGVGTLLPDLAPATYNITAQYSGDSVHGVSTSGAVKVSGTPTGFAIGVNPASLSMAASQNATITVSVNSNNGYADTIALGCGDLPMGVNCHFSSNNVSLKAGAGANVQLTIDTNAPLAGGSTAMNSSARAGLSLAGLFLPAGLFLGWVGWRFRKRSAIYFAALMAILLTGSLAVTGCSGGFTQNMAAPGSYTIQINAVGTNSNITHYQNVSLTITK